MGTLFFIVRCFIVTVVVIMLMQIKIGEHTIEYRVNDMVRTSGIEQPAQYLADGIIKFIRNSWNTLAGGVGTEFSRTLKSESAPGNRSLGIDLNRSAEYLKEQAQRAKTKVEGHLRDEGILTEENQN